MWRDTASTMASKISLAFFLLISVPLQSQNLPAGVIQKIDSVISEAMSRDKIPGLSLAISNGTQVSVSRAYGLANIGDHIAATTSTVYRTASIAKPITATAIMQLRERAKLDLNVPVQAY